MVMKVRLIKMQTIIDYIESNTQSKSGFDIWMKKVKFADWSNIKDVKGSFSSADQIGGTNRIIFDIGGNKYRMICSCKTGIKNFILYINWIGTHGEYDKLCKLNKQYTIDNF